MTTIFIRFVQDMPKLCKTCLGGYWIIRETTLITFVYKVKINKLKLVGVPSGKFWFTNKMKFPLVRIYLVLVPTVEFSITTGRSSRKGELTHNGERLDLYSKVLPSWPIKVIN